MFASDTGLRWSDLHNKKLIIVKNRTYRKEGIRKRGWTIGTAAAFRTVDLEKMPMNVHDSDGALTLNNW